MRSILQNYISFRKLTEANCSHSSDIFVNITKSYKMVTKFFLFPFAIGSNLIILGIAVTQNHNGTKQFQTITPTNNMFVVFDPNTSILDKQNRFRYTISEQLPLIKQVATKFTKLFILLSEIDLREELRTSLSQSAMAVAEYNKLLLPSEKKLEVWLAYSVVNLDHRYEDDFLYHREPSKTINILNSIAQQSNTIYNGTVTTILLPFKLVYNHIDKLVSENGNFDHKTLSVPKWGFLFETDVFYTFPPTQVHESITRLNPNVIIIILMPFIELPQLTIDINFNVREVNRFVQLKNETNFGFLISTADTDFTGKVNMSKLVSTWHLANNWSEATNNTVILSKTFDTPYGDTTERKTGGWWRHLESTDYKSGVDYRFEEKALVAAEHDLKGESSFMFHKQNISFNSDHVEIVFNVFDHTRAKNLQRYTEKEMRVLLIKLLKNFKRVSMVLHDDTGLGTRAFLYELECLDLIRRHVDVSILLLPNVVLKKVFKWDVQLSYVEKTAPHFFPILSSIKTYLGPIEDNVTLNFIRNTYLNGIDTSKSYNFGYLINVTSCGSYLAKDNEEVFKAAQNLLKKDNVTIIIFYFEEDEPTVRLGAERMFHQRVVTMEQCRKLVKKWNLRIEPTLKFMMLHYPTSTKFYTSRWEMANYIEYWQKLSEWAKEKHTTVILSNFIDGHRYSPRLASRYQLRENYITELGWWRLRGDTEEVKGNNMWINKIDDAILRFPDENATSESASLNTTQILLIVFSCLIIVAVVVVVVLYWIRRKGKVEVLLTKGEVDEFYNGMQGRDLERKAEDSPYKLPYEKSLYEICSDAFTIDYENKIGSGEFGMVHLGQIQVQEEIVKVAVKMMNPSNINKSALKGLLSEIKVLSHIGKHEHVIQMMGANTQNLKFGKVYIFLELCELGSLEKYLGKIKTTSENKEGNEAEKGVSLLDDRTKRYLELVSMKRKSLEFSVSQDLLRWSHEICMGMAYLASKHVVHADLATRNVLLSANKEAKICDFGLSRRMYNYTNYVKKQQEPLPWKWMAPEALNRSEFSEKSDVWAYGITIWEIFSLGEQPYPGLTWTVKFASMLEDGLRMDEPKYDNANMYLIMRECWSSKPHSRPTFAELLTLFD